MKIAIIGGGITGLTVAYFLTKNKHEVTIFEKNEVLGGLAASFSNKNWDWPLEHYFHHFFSSDVEAKELMDELGLTGKLKFSKPKTSIFFKGKILQFDNPKSIFSFPYLNSFDKFRVGLVSMALKINPFYKPLENMTAYSFIKKTMGKNVFEIIWKPLLSGKFGNLAEKIPASWFWTRIKKRSFALGYLDGGTETLLESLEENITKENGKILLKTTVERIVKEKNNFVLTINGKNYQEKFDKVLACVPPEKFSEIVPNLMPEEQKLANQYKSLGNICLVLESSQSLLANGTYWLNINEKEFPFVAVVEHTNFIDKKNYDNKSIIYVGGYYPITHPYFKMEKEKIFNKFIPFLKKINPNFKGKSITKCWLFKDYYSQPVVGLNYSEILPITKTSIDGLFWASLHHVYPQDRGVNYAILLGKNIADEILGS